MNDKTQKKLTNLLVELLNHLNNGEKFSREEIELTYNEVKPFLESLSEVDDFPIVLIDGNIYCFTNFTRKHFDKYHIQNIAEIVINYKTNVKYDNSNPSYIIKDYVENKSENSKKIDTIVFDYAVSKACSDSKNIKQLIFDYATKEKKYSQEVFIEKILKYATDIKYSKDIAKCIIDIERYKSFYIEIHDIIKESKLPRRDDKVYQIISSYEPYELTHCISYEMAIRNKDVQAILEKIKTLTLLSRELFKADMLYKIDSTQSYNMEIEQKRKIRESLDNLKIELNIDFNTSNLTEIQSKLFILITEYTVLLEEDYYMIYDRKEIVPEGMEEIFSEPNHYEPDSELNQYMTKTIEESIKNNDYNNTSTGYKSNYATRNGYVVYQASYPDSKHYDINKIFPNFKYPMREFNQTQVAFNMSLPKDEIIAYIEKIKDDYDNKNTSYKTLNQLLYDEDVRVEDRLAHKQKNKYADDFFIYDYYTQSDGKDDIKLEIIQKKLSQYHGMKVEISQNKYESIDYDQAQIEMNTPKPKQNSNSFHDLAKSFKETKHIIHYLETISIIEERYKILKNAIDEKKYKKLINHE